MIPVYDTIRLGFKGLMLHKLRSGLAMLGILIGVTAVVWLVALGEGVSYQAQQQIKDLGATNIIIKSVKPPEATSNGSGSFIFTYGLTRKDYERIVSTIPTIRRAVPMRESKSGAWYAQRETDVALLGCTPEYLPINHLRVARGRFLSNIDLQRGENVAVLAAGTAEKLFPYEDPIGKNVQILVNMKFDIYRVIGVTESRAPSASIGGSLEGRDYNRDVYIPITTFRWRIGDQTISLGSGSREGEEVELSQITLTMGDVEEVEAAAEIVEVLLEKYHKDPDYAVIVPQELLRQAEMLRMMFNILLVLIAGISLLVGGIGIMNIMLATVVERTREIGVRRALGATQGDITRQFLGETVVLSASGGLIGVVGGFLCQPAVRGLRAALRGWLPDVWSSIPPTIQQLEPRIALWSVLVAFGISVGVGIAFGLYPARRAAALDPIEALRHE